MKFKNFSTHIVPVTNFLLVFLIVLSIIGFILIFFLNPDKTTYQVSTASESDNLEQNETQENEESEDDSKEDKSYKNQIIGDEFY